MISNSINPYGCPDSVFTAMRGSMRPMLNAVELLGPDRCRWIKGKCPSFKAGTSPKLNNPNQFTSWALDGKRATEKDLMEAT